MPVKPGINKDNFNSETRIQDDLYRHVNGKWLESFEIPADKAIYGSFYRLRDDSESAVKQILEEAIENPSPGRSTRVAQWIALSLGSGIGGLAGVHCRWCDNVVGSDVVFIRFGIHHPCVIDPAALM